MRLGNFELSVSPGNEMSANGYVAMEHGVQYVIAMVNRSLNQRCDVELSVDGKSMGSFRVDAGGAFRLERPADDNGCFTFYRAGSSEADASGLSKVSSSDMGLIQARFRPEYQPKSAYCGMHVSGGILRRFASFSSNAPVADCCDITAGGTGLSGASSQSFIDVANLNYDPTGEVVISLRLVAGNNSDPRELNPIVKANPVPAPVWR